MAETKKSEAGYHKEPFMYKDDAMSRSVCLICGEHMGNYEYRGKAVCRECIKYMRANF